MNSFLTAWISVCMLVISFNLGVLMKASDVRSNCEHLGATRISNVTIKCEVVK